MSECSQELMKAGKPHPRTCSLCKLGPCQKGHWKGSKAPEQSLSKCWLVENIETGKKVVCMTEERANFLAELMNGLHDEVPIDKAT